MQSKKRRYSQLGTPLVSPARNPVAPQPDLTATPVMPSTPDNISPYVVPSKKGKSDQQSSATGEELLKQAKILDFGFKKAMNLYLQAAGAGNAEAMARLGEIYLSGEGVKQDVEAAYNYFENSARLGCPEGMFRLADYLLGNYCDRFESRGACLEKAAELYSKASQKDHLPSIYKYGYCKLYGFGVDENLVEAFALISKSAESNYPEAVFELANCYYNEWGVNKDVNKAISLYQKAGELGCSEAYLALGRFYDATNEVSQAIQNFEKALELGNRNARYLLDSMKSNRKLTNEEMSNLASTALQSTSTISSSAVKTVNLSSHLKLIPKSPSSLNVKPLSRIVLS